MQGELVIAGVQGVSPIGGQVRVAVGLGHGYSLGMHGGCQPLDAVGEVGELFMCGVADGHDQVVGA